MNHVAIDLGARKSQFCVRDQGGTVLKEGRVETLGLPKLFEGLEKSRVVLESCAEAFAVADMATAAGHEVCIVPSTLAPSLGVGQRGLKTDKRDARNLSLASCRMEQLPTIHCPSPTTRDQRARLTAREGLVSARTQLVNVVRGWARTNLVTIPSGTTAAFPARAREAAEQSPSGLPDFIEQVLKALEALNEQIALANAQVEELAERDAACVRLMSMPGVGPITALSFRSALEDPGRFRSAQAVGSYLGLTPGEKSSGARTTRLGITRAGSSRCRRVLVQAAWSAYRTSREDRMVQWARKLAEKKPPQVAVVALARKMSTILYAMWRDGAAYNPAHES